MNLPLLLVSPVFIVVFKWTCLLTLGWTVHLVLRRRHARWRLILWRSILCFGLVLPLMQFLKVPAIKIPITIENSSASEFPTSLPPVSTANGIQPADSVTQPVKISVATSLASTGANPSWPQTPSKPIRWGIIIVAIWILGCVCGIVRLIRLNRQLTRLQKESCQPASDLQQLGGIL